MKSVTTQLFNQPTNITLTTMKLSKNMLMPMGLALLVGACSPYYPPHPNDPAAQPKKAPNQQTLTPEQQRLLEQSRAGQPIQPSADSGLAPSGPTVTPGSSTGLTTPSTPIAPPTNVTAPKKVNYPTAASVPGKDGFVFNPYTHNIVDVKGIPSGKLCRDPEDADPTHKYRVP